MIKYNIIQNISCLIIILFFTLFAYGNDKIKDTNNNSAAIFIIDYNVNLYKDKDSTDVQKKITFFDSITVLSEEITTKGRINVKLQDGTEGWVEEKYTSYIPKNWKKLVLLENYYCHILTDKKLDVYKDEVKQGKMFYYSNKDINIAMGVNYFNNYQEQLRSMQHTINMQIQGGHVKNLNWNKEFNIGNYKINYVITTDHENDGIEESFDFVKIEELTLKKCYTVAIDYMPYTSDKKKLLWRKILFSTLQSLK